MPALAVADALRDSGAEVSFLGARGRSEQELVPAAGYEIDLLDVRGLDRRNPARAAAAAWLAARGVARARTILRRRGVEAVLGGGGYVAGPAGVAAISLRLPLVLTEADRHLGLANRLLAPRARRVCLAFPVPGRSGDRYLVTGRPVPAAIAAADREAARRRFGIAAGDRCLLVFGGSQGARSINLAALDAFAAPEAESPHRDYHVLHISGGRDFAEVEGRLAAGGPPPRYTLLAYEQGLADALAASDLVLARAGGSIFEIAAAGRPAILVPYPYASARHQHANAEWMADAGAAIVIEDADLDGARLRAAVAELLADSDRLERMGAASVSLARPEAARAVADELLAAAAG
ncbi:MAG TPA: UDP-N-acetylglucosamine--N-acetylmuramyl-(pentapeptide) pyrophosphoryl-undecaprenol N-acetylglucosamine transferase [Solirubrobacterales bacterium]|nr:UDP-N-acetylglucosamine--N-acetylmuramyl-(pentapeptide) pyrophosphoryl-undecaprenol N-acetylglucosamine transferase [Solirubrobacterales bacterium]